MKMGQIRLKNSLLLTGLLLCGCSAVSPPPPPPLPVSGAKGNVPEVLSMADLKALDQMMQWSNWMVALGKMTESHSNQLVILHYGKEMTNNYQKQQDIIKGLVKKHHIKLATDLSEKQQGQLLVLGRRYGTVFDKGLERAVLGKMPLQLRILQKADQQKDLSKEVVALLLAFFSQVRRVQNQAYNLLGYYKM